MKQLHTKKSRLRVRSVTFKKNGCKLHFVDTGRERNHKDVRDALSEIIADLDKDEDFDGQLAGFAFVAWTPSARCRFTRIKCTEDSALFRSGVPDYVQQALRHHYIDQIRAT